MAISGVNYSKSVRQLEAKPLPLNPEHFSLKQAKMAQNYKKKRHTLSAEQACAKIV